MNKILLFLIASVSAIAIFIAGAYSGIYVLTNIVSTTQLQNIFVESIQTEYTLQYLDKTEINSARNFLKNHSDLSVIKIDGLAKYADPESLITACGMLKNIAKHRSEFRTQYPITTETDKNVEKILSKWESKTCKQQSNNAFKRDAGKAPRPLT